ncbi:murein L,D-transpeptidase catalytic domain family protein [Ferruginibacter paludis]|uniref:murein L,D-transpeptidase catalytic domain-containing protein n=1 Tax=Ferruginibacter paludis TaxID=1310417 RepID=UPI0025B5289F|nr:murein L,D-transpeptidase catalytic domain family protein [Ferruginibacter paludis]MDN3657526.1 murein L,D-transpeptidase catalytic domain family protein [Ferruginibacter paludis]
MKLFLKLSATLLLLVIAITALGYFLWYKPKFNSTKNAGKFVYKTTAGDVSVLQRLQQKALSVKEYSKLNQYNSDYCFMVDMKIASGKNSFFVYNLKRDSIEMAGLVAHGSGRSMLGSVQFSNNANSLCTSLGKYKIGNSYNGKFGLAFKLYGLDATNSNAYNRFVVLHAHPCVPNTETAPLPICESWGCPTVAPLFLNELQKLINRSDKPVLLEIYY